MQYKSTDVRTNLKAVLRTVYETQETAEILLDGKVVAHLTLQQPTGMPPKRINTGEATKGWSELLNYVFIMGARYRFRVMFDGDESAPPIFLVRPEKSRNRFDEAWKEHKKAYLATQDAPDLRERIEDLRGALQEDMVAALEDMKEFVESSVTKINHKIGTAFAGLNRPNGDLQAYPETGLVRFKSAKDLDTPEAD